jgi:hypothetical protein
LLHAGNGTFWDTLISETIVISGNTVKRSKSHCFRKNAKDLKYRAEWERDSTLMRRVLFTRGKGMRQKQSGEVKIWE